MELLQEPSVYLCQFVYLVDGISSSKSFRDDEDALVGRFAESFVHIVDDEFFVVDKAMHALSYHSQSLLYGLLKGASDGHDLSHGLHGRAKFAVYTMELSEVPTWYLADDIVEGRFEEGARSLCDRVLQVEETIAKSEFGSHEGEWVTCGLRGKGRRAAQASIDLYDAVVLALRVVGVLHVALSHDAHMAHDAYGQFAEFVVVGVGQCLGGSNDDALACMYAERVEVLHVADSDAVVEAVAHHLILHFLPSSEALLHQHLW